MRISCMKIAYSGGKRKGGRDRLLLHKSGGLSTGSIAYSVIPLKNGQFAKQTYTSEWGGEASVRFHI